MKRVTIKKKAQNGLAVENNQVEALSSSTLLLKGKSHRKGGTDISYGGQIVEAEAGEPISIDQEGSLNIFGAMVNPVTGRKFKSDAKRIGEKEAKMETLLSKGVGLVNNSDPNDKWDVLKFNSGRAMSVGAKQKLDELAQSKEQLGVIQDAMLERADELGVDPEAFSKGKMKKAKWGSRMQAGGTINPPDWNRYAQEEALRQGVNPEVIRNLIYTESRGKTNAVSKKGAKGIMQFTPATAKQYGLKESQLTSNNPNDVQQVVNAGIQHFKGLLNNYNHDYTLALAAYNGGPGSVDFVKKQTGNNNITGSDWVKFMQNRRAAKPTDKQHAWQNETLDYVTNIMANDPESFSANADRFRSNYYDVMAGDYTLPPLTVTAMRKSTPVPTTPPVPGMPSPNPVDSTSPYDAPTVESPTVPGTQRRGFRRITGRDYELPGLVDPNTPIVPSDASNFPVSQIIPELYAAASNRTEPVFAQTYSSDLFTPYSISLQDRRNLNNQTFRAVSQRLTDNPGALSTLAAQKYEADNQVNAEEFRINQGIQNDITNRNVQLLNDAESKNLQIADTQYVRQAQARSKTKATNQAVLNSISDKVAKHTLENRTLQVYENLYPNFRFGDDYNINKVTPNTLDEEINWGGANSMTPNPATSTRVTRDGNGQIKRISESTPSIMKQQQDNLKMDRSISKMLKDGDFMFNSRTGTVEQRKNNYSPLKGYDYSK